MACGVVVVHGGVKFYRGAPKAARSYLERDHSRADDYYLREGDGLALRLAATPEGVERAETMDGDAYEKWVAGVDLDTDQPKGRIREDEHALRFLEVIVNGPKTWSLAAALHPEISAALDAAQDRAAAEIVGWVAAHATTRIGPRGRQVQIGVDHVEAAAIRHYTSRAGDPHRHLHLQINARVFAAGAWRGIHSVGVRDSIEAINGIGHAAVATDPAFRAVLVTHGFTLDPHNSEIRELMPYAGRFSARAQQIRRNIDRYEAGWRRAHPGQEPGPRLRAGWDQRAWAEARPDKPPKTGHGDAADKPVAVDGAELVARWNQELRDLGHRDFTAPAPPEPVRPGARPGWIDRDAAAELVLAQLGAKRSAWNAADIRGRVEVLLARTGLVTDTSVRVELAEDVTHRAVDRCVQLLACPDVPEHVRALTSQRVLAVEADIVDRLAARGRVPARRTRIAGRGLVRIDPTQAAVVGVLAGDGTLVVVEGAAGAGKTTALAAAQATLARQGRRMLVVTPTLKAAQVAASETGAEGHSAAWLIRQHGWRWDDDGHWTRQPDTSPGAMTPAAESLRAGDLLLVDEAGMLDQDTAHALMTIADETGARLALVGDRHQLPAVGRGGVLDHAHHWAHPTAVVTLESVHRFTDPDYAALTLKMRTGKDSAAVFDELCRRGLIQVHRSEVERTAALAQLGADGALVLAERRELVSDLNAAIRDQRNESDPVGARRLVVTTAAGERIGVGDRVATRRNDRDVQVANRQTWAVTDIHTDGSLVLRGDGRVREVPADYATRFVELAYATTIHGAQGETVDQVHLAIEDTTSAAGAYVAMTRGRHNNTAHVVADSIDEARRLWINVFSRDRADLGPAHARTLAAEAIENYGPNAPRRPYPNASPIPFTPQRPDTGIGL